MYATTEPEVGDLSPLEKLTDSDLIVQARRGNDAALGVLLRRHQDALYRFCCHLTGDPNEAEDVCQEALARAITRVDRLNASEKFRCWLFSIARNLSIDAHRSKKRLCALPEDDHVPIQLYGEDVHSAIEIQEEHQTVAEALGKLAKSHQNVLMMREVEGLSYAEIALRLDVSQSAVETLLFRARRRLREEYGKKVARAPAFGLLAGIRGWLSRLATPWSGATVAGKVAVGTLSLGLMAGAAVSVPRVYNALAHPSTSRYGLQGSGSTSAVSGSSASANTPGVTLGGSRLNGKAGAASLPSLAAAGHQGGSALGRSAAGTTSSGAGAAASKSSSSTAPASGSKAAAGVQGSAASVSSGSSSSTARSGGKASPVSIGSQTSGRGVGSPSHSGNASGSSTSSARGGNTAVTSGGSNAPVSTPSAANQASSSAQSTVSQTVGQTTNSANQAASQAQNLSGQVQTTAQNTVGQAQSTANTAKSSASGTAASAKGSATKTVATVTSQGQKVVATVTSKAGSGGKVVGKVPTPAPLPTVVPTLPVPVP